MPHLSENARTAGSRTALIEAETGRHTDFATLDAMVNRTARLLIGLGAERGGNIAICLPNIRELAVLILAAQRSGSYYTLIPSSASAKDVAYFVQDSGATLLLTDAETAGAVAAEGSVPGTVQTIALSADGAGSLEARIADHPPVPHPAFAAGTEMNYSSGSTGRPKGIRRPLPDRPWDAPDPRNVAVAASWGIGADAVLLNTSPLYHSAPHRFLATSVEAGACHVLMHRFDAATALDAIERWRCTHSIWVPTMFHRLLTLPDDARNARDLSSMRMAIHGAAPCPVQTKQAMIDWWGPVLLEYYSGTEGIGSTLITSADWLLHKGSVGKPTDSVVHILGTDETPLPARAEGTVYFESPATFSYWKASEKTRASISRQGWKTFGDTGYVDEDGYLYLTGRNNFTINSGGVNLYPQEIEAAILTAPGVADAVVIAIPDADFGERAVALVQLDAAGADDAARLEALRQQVRADLGPIKTPKAFHVVSSTQRTETGKLKRTEIRDAFLRGTIEITESI
ncbi:AMP-binding protein [Paracoccus sp. (in: a-proteobacteria)]|uniref:AMP-binding protein n=1 Tax=Paracoccus sp. TaxID=267 RepID=UPI003A8BCB37